MFGEAVRVCFSRRLQESLHYQGVQRPPRPRPRLAGHRLRVRERGAALPAGEGEQPCLRLAEFYSELRLPRLLIFAEQLLAHKQKLECLPRLVVIDER